MHDLSYLHDTFIALYKSFSHVLSCLYYPALLFINDAFILSNDITFFFDSHYRHCLAKDNFALTMAPTVLWIGLGNMGRVRFIRLISDTRSYKY